MEWKKILPIIGIIIVILGCIAAIVAPAIVVDSSSKIAPILIGSVVLLVILVYLIWKAPSEYKKAILPLLYFGALIGGIIGFSVSNIDEGAQIAGIIFFSLLLLLSIVIGISYSGPNGQGYVSIFIYLLVIAALAASIGLIWTETFDTGGVKILATVCLSIVLGLTVLLGIYSYFTNKSVGPVKAIGKYNFLGLNPKIQIDRIKSWGINKYGAFTMFVVLVAAVVLLYIGGAQFIDVYKNTTSKSDFDKNFALVWAILNFLVAAWITIQTLYFIIALGMMYYENYKKECLDLVKANTAKTEDGLPTGKLKELLDEYNLAYSSTDPTKTGYVDVITQPGAIDSNGIFIPGEFLEEDKITIKRDPAVRLALDTYLQKHHKDATTVGTVNIPSSTDVTALIAFTAEQLRRGGVPNDIVIDLRARLEELGGQAVRYQTAEAAEAAAVRVATRAREAQFEAIAAREEIERGAREISEAAGRETRAARDARDAAENDRRSALEARDRARAAAARAEAARAEAATRRAAAEAAAEAARRRVATAETEAETAIGAANIREAAARAEEARSIAAARTSESATARLIEAATATEAERTRIEAERTRIEAERAGLPERLRTAVTTARARAEAATRRELQGTIDEVNEAAETARRRVAEAEAASRAANQAVVIANRTAERLRTEAQANATRAVEAEAARDEALRAEERAREAATILEGRVEEARTIVERLEASEDRTRARIALAESGEENAAAAVDRALRELEEVQNERVLLAQQLQEIERERTAAVTALGTLPERNLKLNAAATSLRNAIIADVNQKSTAIYLSTKTPDEKRRFFVSEYRSYLSDPLFDESILKEGVNSSILNPTIKTELNRLIDTVRNRFLGEQIDREGTVTAGGAGGRT